MSLCYEVKKEDIELSDDKKDIHFWLYQDNCGQVYCSAKVEDVKKVIGQESEVQMNKPRGEKVISVDSLELMLMKAEQIREHLLNANYGLLAIDLEALINNIKYHLESK